MKKMIVFVMFLASLNIYASDASHETSREEDQVTEKVPAAAKDQLIVSQPAGCLIHKSVPCTFKSLARRVVRIGSAEFVFLKGAVVKIEEFAPLTIEPLVSGFIILSSRDPISVKGVSLSQFPSYADTTKDQIEVIDGKDFFVFRITSDEPERYLLDREPFIKKLASFYTNVNSLRADYKNISPIYNKSFKQDLADHKKTLTRKIASLEEQKEEEAKRQRRIREQQRKNKEIFFKRTFVQ